MRMVSSFFFSLFCIFICLAVVTVRCNCVRLDPDALYLAQVLIEKQLYWKLELNFSHIFSRLKRLKIYIQCCFISGNLVKD